MTDILVNNRSKWPENRHQQPAAATTTVAATTTRTRRTTRNSRSTTVTSRSSTSSSSSSASSTSSINKDITNSIKLKGDERTQANLALVRRCFVLCVRLSPSCYSLDYSTAKWIQSQNDGVAVHCADCGSSNSDITEPCSPLSTTSLDDMPPTAARRSPAPPASVVRRPPSSASPVTDQTAVQWPWTDPPSKRPKQGKITEYFRSKGGNNTKNSIIASAAANVASSLTKESSIRQSWVTSPVSKFLNSSVKSGVRLTEVGGGGCGGGGEVGGVSSSGAPSSNNSDNSCSVGGGDEVEEDDDEDEEEDDDYGVEVEEEEVAVVGRNNRRRRRRRSVKSVDSTESGGISATYSSNSNNISISKSVNSSASDCKQTSSTITSSAAVEGGAVTATATAVVNSSTSTSADCTISAENAEENSSSGASDISSLLTTSSTSSSSTRTAATISTAIDSSDIGIKQQIEKKDGEERTIRFPVINGWRGHYVSDVICRWTDCGAKFTTSTALLEHLQINHVNSQTLSENYVCRWSECKVYDRKSCSRTWLERHVLSHGGNKPYRCIVDGCGHRFSSQTLLQRHVNNHFTEREQKGDSKKGCETANKLIRRNGKKLRYRRQPFSARRYDYFDAGIMEGLQHNLIDVTERRTQGQFDNVPGDEVLLKSRILGRKVDENGETRVLLRWFPHNILNDEWVKLDEITRAKTVSIRRLSVQSKDNLYQYLLNTNRKRQETTEILDRRRRRKQFSSANYYYNSSSVEVSASSSSSSSAAISANSSSISAGAASVLYDAGISCNGGNVLSPSSDKSSSSSSYSTSSSSCFSSSSTSTSTSYYNNVNNNNNNTNSDLLHQTLPFSVSLPIKTTVLTVQTT